MRRAAGAPPLEGLRVLDVATIFAGPLIATVLGDFGADVVKVERPRAGDSLRGLGWDKDGVPLWWKVVGRNKRSVTLDLHDARGRDILANLAADADVLVENFRPGRMEAWGLGWDDLHRRNPRLVMVRTTGFGQDGPYASRPGFGTLVEAMSGFAHVTGASDGPPTLPPFGLADTVTALTGAYATMLALYHRDARGGRGQCIDLSILEAMLPVLGPQITVYQQLGEVQERMGNSIPFSCPRNLYRTSDGHWVALSASAESIARRVFEIIDRPELAADPRYATNQARLENRDEVDRVIAEWMARHSLDQVMTAFERGQAAVAPVYSAADVYDDPHLRSRGAIVTLDDDQLDTVAMHDVVPRLCATPGRIGHAGPALGEHTDDILGAELGLSAEQIAALRSEGVV